MSNEISMDAESIVAEKGFLHQQIFNAEERISRVLSGNKTSVGSKGEEYGEKLGIRDRNRCLLGLIAHLDSILTHYHNEEYLKARQKIKLEMSVTKHFRERRIQDLACPTVVEYSLNDFDPDQYFNLCLRWHSLICEKLFNACGYFEAGREGIPFDDEMKKKRDLEKIRLKGKSFADVPLRFSEKRTHYRNQAKTEIFPNKG